MINTVKCKPLREFVFTFDGQDNSCFIRFDPRQVWTFSRIGNNQVEVWRDNISIRMDINDFTNRFKGV